MAYIKPNKEKDYAMILGASSGFGESVALELAEAGFNIIGVHLDRGTGLTKVEQIKRQIEDKGVDAVYFNVNAASEKKREEVIQGINDHFSQKGTPGKIKMFLHSLAFGSLAPFIHMDPKERLSKGSIGAHSVNEMFIFRCIFDIVFIAADRGRGSI